MSIQVAIFCRVFKRSFRIVKNNFMFQALFVTNWLEIFSRQFHLFTLNIVQPCLQWNPTVDIGYLLHEQQENIVKQQVAYLFVQIFSFLI